MSNTPKSNVQCLIWRKLTLKLLFLGEIVRLTPGASLSFVDNTRLTNRKFPDIGITVKVKGSKMFVLLCVSLCALCAVLLPAEAGLPH